MSIIKLPPYILDSTLDFTFNNVTATGNLVSLNANLGNLATANFVSGNGSLLTGLTGANVLGNVAQAVHSYYTDTANSVAGANVSGQVSNALVAGTVYTNAQPNITSVGTLTSLAVTGDGSFGGNLTITGNLTISGTQTVVNSTTVNINDINIVLANNATTAAQANGAGITINGASANIIYDVTSNSFAFSHAITADGALLSNIAGANVTGTVGNAAHATISDSANSVAVANVTGIGNIATINKDGNASNILYGNGIFAAAPSGGTGASDLANLTDVALANLTNGDILSYDSANSKWINAVNAGGGGSGSSSANSPYVTRTYTGDGTTTNYTVTSGATTNSVIVSLSGIIQTPTSDYSVTGTTLSFTTAPPNGVSIQIREIGIPMSSGSNSQLLFNDAGVIGGTANLTFNKTTGMLTAAKLTTTSANLGDAANLRLTGGNVGDLLATVGNGVLAWANVAANGNVIINGSVGGGGASVTVNTTAPDTPTEGDLWLDSESGELNVYFGNAWAAVSASAGQLDIQVNNFTGDGIQSDFTLTVTPAGSNYTIVTVGGVVQPRNYYNIDGSTLSFGTPPPAYTPIEISIFGGSASPIGLAGSVTNGAQPNITSVGTLTSLTSSGNITANYFIGNGSQLTGITAATATTAATVTTAAQPNITSVGTLTILSVTGNISGANITGNLYGNGSAISSLNASNITGQVSNALVAGTVYTNAQANITSVGTLTSLTVSGLSTFGTSAENFTALSGATGVVAHDTSTAGTFYHTTPAANFTVNFTNVPTTSSKIIVLVLVIAQGASVYLPTVMQIDGTTQTVVWSGGSAPTGNANKYDVISYSLFRIGSTWTVFGSASSFG